MSEITNQPLYLIKFDDTEVPDETVFGAEVANKRFEQISGNWNAHLFVKVASNSRDDSCSGSNAKLASDYDALAAQRDEGLAREAELQSENERIKARLCMCRDCGDQGEIYSGHSTYQGYNQPPEPHMDICGTCGGDGVLGPVEDFEALATERDDLKQHLAEADRKYDEALAEMQAVIDTGVLTAADYESLEAEICARITDYWKRPTKPGPGCADEEKAE